MQLREGKIQAALEQLHHLPDSPFFHSRALAACYSTPRPPDAEQLWAQAEKDALAFHDPEPKYGSAVNYSACRGSAFTARLLKSAIAGGFCAYENMQSESCRSPPPKCSPQRWDQTLPHLGGHLLPHGHQILGGKVPGVLPKQAVVGNLHCFHGQLKLIAHLLKVSSDDSANMHFLARLLQVEPRGRVLAGGGKRTNGQGAHLTQSGGNLIGQRHAQKIRILVSTEILKRKDGNGYGSGRGSFCVWGRRRFEAPCEDGAQSQQNYRAQPPNP
jgi:hypothetical protein